LAAAAPFVNTGLHIGDAFEAIALETVPLVDSEKKRARF